MLGEIKNWKEVGGEDKKINLIVRANIGTGVGTSARELLFHDRKQEFFKDATIINTSNPIRKAVMADPYAFGVDDVTSANRIKGLKLIKIDGVAPTKESILSNKYKLRRPFFLYLDEKPSKLAKKYVDFALSDEGQSIISRTKTANLEEAIGEGDKENFIFQDLQFNVKTK